MSKINYKVYTSCLGAEISLLIGQNVIISCDLHVVSFVWKTPVLLNPTIYE